LSHSELPGADSPATESTTAAPTATVRDTKTTPIVVSYNKEGPSPHRISVWAKLGDQKLAAVIDTGASVTLVDSRVAPQVTRPWPGPDIVSANGESLEVQGVTDLNLELGTLRVTQAATVVRRLAADLLLGTDILERHHAVLDLPRRQLRLGTHVIPLADPSFGPDPITRRDHHLAAIAASTAPHPSNSYIHAAPNDDQPAREDDDDVAAPISYSASLPLGDPVFGIDHLPPDNAAQLRQLLNNFSDCFAANPRQPGVTHATTHTIPTGAHPPIFVRPHRMSPQEAAVQQTEVDTMLKDGIIRPSASTWSSPVVLVRKKDGTRRFCVDFRRLNAVTQRDQFPLPRIDDTLDALVGCTCFTSLDLAAGYWQIPIAPEDCAKTAFSVLDGHYEFTVMPFGLSNAPASFQRAMTACLGPALHNCCLVYLDDIIIYSPTFTAHLEHLRLVLSCLRASGFHLKVSKCHFARQQLLYLGHVINSRGVHTDPLKVAAVKEFPTPSCIDDVRRFIGLASYYRRFVPGFASIAQPLHDLLRKDTPFTWQSAQDDAFTQLRHALTTAPVLAYPDHSLPFELSTDASSVGLGAILTQPHSDGTNRVVSYASRSLNKAERNYSATERECLAIVWALQHFRPYVLDRPCVVYTDHRALTFLASLRNPTGRLARWTLQLQEYRPDIRYRPGSANLPADALSRAPLLAAAAITTTHHRPPPTITPAATDLFREAQADDPDAAAAITFVQHKLLPDDPERARLITALADGLHLNDGLLMYHPPARSIGRTLAWSRVVVPPSLRPWILRTMHDDPISGGHLGIAKTYAKLADRFWWPHLYRDTTSHVTSCTTCAMRKRQTTRPAGLLQPIKVTAPWELVAMDYLGPLPTTTAGNKYILVFMDHFTKWPEAFAVPAADANQAARHLLVAIIARFGAPRRLLSDRGTHFINQVVQRTCELFAISRSTSTAYHPQTDGTVERFNRTLLDMLTGFVSSRQQDWDTYLPLVLQAYRAAPHASTGFSPHELLFGRPALLPLDASLPLQSASDGPQEPTDHLAELHQTFTKIWAQAIARMSSSHATAKSRYDSHHRDVDFAVGERVWLHVPVTPRGLSPKLATRFQGPFTIARRVGPVTYAIASHNRRLHQIVHVGRLKKFSELSAHLDISDPDPPTLQDATDDPLQDATDDPIVDLGSSSSPSDTDDVPPALKAPPPGPVDASDAQFIVEKIVSHRRRGRGYQYLVRWKGYDDSQDQWLPTHDINPDIITAYRNTLRPAETPAAEDVSFAEGEAV
jgi:predicted aspartyl protease